MATSTVQSDLQKFGVAQLWNPNDPLMPTYQQLALTYKITGAPAGFVEYCTACLIARAFLYEKQSPGDCGNAGGFNISGAGTNSNITKGLATAATYDPEPISKGILSVFASIGGVFTAHHAQAIVTEQQTLCTVSQQVNQAWFQIDSAVAAGTLSSSVAISTLQSVDSQATTEMARIKKTCNAACVSTQIVHAITDLRTQLYKSQGQQAAVALTSSNGIVFAGLAAAAAHFAGVF